MPAPSHDLSVLTLQQLDALIQNKRLPRNIREKAQEERDRRYEGMDAPASVTLHASVPAKARQSLHTWQKIMLLLFPFPLVIHSLFAGRMLANGYARKWRQFRLFSMLGFVLWILLLLLFSKLVLFARQE